MGVINEYDSDRSCVSSVEMGVQEACCETVSEEGRVSRVLEESDVEAGGLISDESASITDLVSRLAALDVDTVDVEDGFEYETGEGGRGLELLAPVETVREDDSSVEGLCQGMPELRERELR